MIYLDHNSASACDPEVVAKMTDALSRRFGNPRSRDHAFGWDAEEAVAEARAHAAALLGADPREILFTGSATESIRLALDGLFPGSAVPSPAAPEDPAVPVNPTTPGYPAGERGVALSSVEHEAVLGACRRLAARGIPTHRLAVYSEGNLDITSLAAVLSGRKPAVLALMAANNETGVLFPIRECAALARAHGARLFVDATQALGRVPLDAREDGFDLAAFSTHKIHGPKGVGGLYVRGGADAMFPDAMRQDSPWPIGGGFGPHAGTPNVPGIVGFGEACRIARERMAGDMARLRSLRDRFEDAVLAACPEVRVNGARDARLPNTSNLLFPGVDARLFLRALPGVAASTRSACASGSAEPSHVLKAMGLSDAEAFASVRFSLGRFTTTEEIDSAAAQVSTAYARLRPTDAPATAAPAISAPAAAVPD